MKKTDYESTINKKSKIYHFDRIRINTKAYLKTLHKNLPVKKLRNECVSIKLLAPFQKAFEYGYKSRLEIVAPSKRFFEILMDHESCLKPYRITRLEIAKDIICESIDEAERLNRMWAKDSRKKYSGNFNYDDIYCDTKPDLKKGLIGTFTAYFGNEKAKFKLCSYVRYSKINGKICIHPEWRILGSHTIKNKTGIEEIGDLIAFKIEKFFENQEEKYIVHAEDINTEKLGNWLLGWNRKRSFTLREKRRKGLTTRIFLNSNKIGNFSDLVSYFMRKKDLIKKIKGRKSKHHLKILGVKNYKRFKK